MRPLRTTGFSLLCLLLASLPGRGQPIPISIDPESFDRSRSHVDIPHGKPFDQEELLRRISELKAKGIDTKLLETVAKAKQQLVNEPKSEQETIAKVREQMKAQPGVQKDFEPLVKAIEDKDENGIVEQLKRLQEKHPELIKIIEQLAAANPNPISLPPTVTPPMGKTTVTPPPPPPLNRISEEELAQRTQFAEWLLKQTKQLENTTLAQSPIVQQLGRDLERYARDALLNPMNRSGVDQDFLKQLMKVSKELRPDELWSKWGLPDMPNLYVPGISGNLPRWTPPAPGPGLNLPRVRPSAPEIGAGATVLGVLVVLTILFAVWRLLALYGPRGDAGAAARRYEGRWPVDPESVSTRQDLILAFEHVSLCRLGLEVKTWNHRDIAAALGCTDAEENRQAALLADLYERARYAPASDPLPGDLLPGARRALVSLAGTASS